MASSLLWNDFLNMIGVRDDHRRHQEDMRLIQASYRASLQTVKSALDPLEALSEAISNPRVDPDLARTIEAACFAHAAAARDDKRSN